MSTPTRDRGPDGTSTTSGPPTPASPSAGEGGPSSRLGRRLDGLRRTSPWVLLQRYGALLALVVLLVYNAVDT